MLESDRFPPGTAVRIAGGGVGMVRDGTWAERVAVPDAGLEALPPGTEMAVAACFFSGLATAHAALHRVGSLAPGERVAVTGATGLVGSLTMQVALRAGAGAVVGFHRSEEGAALIPAGAESVVWEGKATVERIAEEEAFDLLVDQVGGETLALLATRATRPGGRVALVGYVGGDEIPIPITHLLGANVSLLPVNLKRLVAELPPAAELLAEIETAGLVLRTTSVPMAEFERGFELLREGTAGGAVILTPDGRDGDHPPGLDLEPDRSPTSTSPSTRTTTRTPASLATRALRGGSASGSIHGPEGSWRRPNV